jgi:hypothetical protein
VPRVFPGVEGGDLVAANQQAEGHAGGQDGAEPLQGVDGVAGRGVAALGVPTGSIDFVGPDGAWAGKVESQVEHGEAVGIGSVRTAGFVRIASGGDIEEPAGGAKEAGDDGEGADGVIEVGRVETAAVDDDGVEFV